MTNLMTACRIAVGMLLVLGKFANAQAAAPAVDPSVLLAQIQASEQKGKAVGTETTANFPRSEYSFQVSGILEGGSGAPITSKVTAGSLGYLIGLRYHLNPWEAVDLEFGSTARGNFYVQGLSTSAPFRINRLSLSEVITANSRNKVAPFFLVGAGIADFGFSGSTTAKRLQPVANLGLGTDLRLIHFGFRLQVEELIYRDPNGGSGTSPAKWLHLAQPSAGVIISF